MNTSLHRLLFESNDLRCVNSLLLKLLWLWRSEYCFHFFLWSNVCIHWRSNGFSILIVSILTSFRPMGSPRNTYGKRFNIGLFSRFFTPTTPAHELRRCDCQSIRFLIKTLWLTRRVPLECLLFVRTIITCFCNQIFELVTRPGDGTIVTFRTNLGVLLLFFHLLY
jgi:hypothetical protein